MEREPPSTAIAEVEHAREAAARFEWEVAYQILNRIDQVSGLAAGDLELLATSAFLTGQREESRSARMRAYHVYVQAGDSRRAARCAVRIGLDRVSTGEIIQPEGVSRLRLAAARLGERGQRSISPMKEKVLSRDTY